MQAKHCSRCSQEKDISQFGIDNRRNRPKAICKQCDSEIHRIRYSAPMSHEQKQANRIAASLRAKRRYEKRRELGLCVECGNRAVDGTTKCDVHLAKAMEKEANRRIKLFKTNLCTRCFKNETINGSRRCEVCKAERRQGIVERYRNISHEQRREQNKVRYRKLKDECYAAYGGYVCACCSETEPMFLTIDHVDNDGAQHRNGMFTHRWYGSIYGWLRRNNFPSGFQVLCHNCNSGKHRNGGICPHQVKKELQLAN